MHYYSLPWLDTSSLTILDLGTTLTNYVVNSKDRRVIEDTGPLLDNVVVVFYQSRGTTEEQWSIMSLDLVMGLVGGLAGIMWATLDLIIGNYESFRYENSLIGSIYPTSPVIMDADETSDLNSESYAKRQMMLTVAERGKYHYRYGEYLCTRLYRKLCCCCKTTGGRCESRIKRLQRHEQASEKLAEELDVVKFLYVHRIG